LNKKSKQTSSKQTQASTIRIIGGSWRSRKLPVVSANGLRPTTDKMRETLFNWLAPYLHGANVLDAFAGTGALGLESLSRGAKHTTFIELNPQAAKQLKTNIGTLKCQHGVVHNQSALAYLEQTTKPCSSSPSNTTLPNPACFDIVFIDPPFNDDLWARTLQLLSQGWLAPHAILYIETPADYALTLPSNSTHNTQQWQILKEKKTGQVRSILVQLAN